jgi:hypothetical protein
MGMAQTARVSSVGMTDYDTTPTHTVVLRSEMSDIRHHTQHPKSRISSRRLPEAYGKHSFCASSAHATGLPLRTEAIRDCIGVVWAVPGRAVEATHEATKAHGVDLRLPTTPTAQGGWTTCARVRRLSMPTACLSSAMAFASHGTGHGVAAGRGRTSRRLRGSGNRASGAFFRFGPFLGEFRVGVRNS